MKIAVVTFPADVKTDNDVFIEGLERAGHKVVKIIFDGRKIVEDVLKSELDEVDVVWAPYERENKVAVWLGEILNKPVVGHYELISPWRTLKEDPTKWGYDVDQLSTFELEKEKWIKYYKEEIYFYKKCDTITSPTEYCFNTVNNLEPVEKEWKEKPYIIDDKLLLKYKVDRAKKEDIITIGRLVPHKRIHHIIKALAKIENAPVLKIIGYGPEKEILQMLANELKVKIEFLGAGQQGHKAYVLQNSKLLVTPCASLPLGEASLFKIPTIMYDVETMIQKHGKMGVYVENNNIDALAEKIKYYLDNPEEANKEGKRSYDVLVNGETGLCLSEEATNRMIKIFSEAIK